MCDIRYWIVLSEKWGHCNTAPPFAIQKLPASVNPSYNFMNLSTNRSVFLPRLGSKGPTV